ncbi:unnamed protein product [Cercospora beticola]|nr:unnamed protein product [Cercospora beticola]
MRVATASYCAVASASCVMNAEYALDDHFRADWERTNAQLVADARHAFAGRASVSPSAFNCSFAAWCSEDVGSEYRNPEAASIYRYTIAPGIAKYSSCLLNLSHAIDDRLHEFREAGAQLVSIWDDEYQHIISLNTPQLFLHHLTRSLAITYNKRGRQQKTPDDDTTLTRLIAACTPVHSAYRYFLSRPTIDERIHLLRSTLSSAHKLETLAQHCSSIATSSLADLERHKPQLDDLCSDYIDFDPLIDDLTAFFQGDRPRMPSHVKTDNDDAGTITLNLDSTAWELTWARLVNSRITTTLDQVLHDMTTRPEVWIQGQAFFRLASGLSLGDMTLQKERMDRWLEIVDPPLVTHGGEGGTKRTQKE